MTELSAGHLQALSPSESLRDRVERALSTAIVSGELTAGTLVSVPALAARFGVSVTPVREAMLDLQNRGFVEPIRNKGFRVTAVEPADLREIIMLRGWIEAPAFRAAARVFPRERITEFRALADAIVAAVDRGDLSAYLHTDDEFHLSILRLLDSRRLIEMVRSLRQQTRMVNLTHMDTPAIRRSATEHHQMLDLFMDGDEEALGELVVQHISIVLDLEP